MSQLSDDWARAKLDQLDGYLNAHGAEMHALRAAGVSEHRIDALYPFEIADYYAALRQLVPVGRSTDGLLTIFAFSKVFYGAAQHISQQSYPLASKVSMQKLADHEPLAGLQNRNLIFLNILQVPIVLRSLAKGEPLRSVEDSEATMSPRGRSLKEEAGSFELFENVVEEFLTYLADKVGQEAR